MGAAPSTDATSQQAQPVKDVAKPHNCENILKYADSTLDKSSRSAIYDQLCAGVFLNQKKKKYWVERESRNNCFMLYAQGLSITWGDDKRYWIWPLLKESSDESVVVAELLNVSWLEIHGKFDTANLSPGINYEVAFVLMLKDVSYGWEVPVNFKLSLPDGSTQEHKVKLMEKPKEQWIEIPAGQLKASACHNMGEIKFSMYETEGGKWKKGLVVKGVVIRPKH